MVAAVHTDWTVVPVLMTVKDFAAKHSVFKEATIRDIIFRSQHPESPRPGWDARGFDQVLVRCGRKVLINETAFFSWLSASQKARAHDE